MRCPWCDGIFFSWAVYWTYLNNGGGRLEIYLDLVVLLNFLVDFLLLLGTNRLAGCPPGVLRCALASLLGASYSAACLVPGFGFLGSTLWRLVALGLMSLICFGMNSSALKRGAIFLLLSMALGGMALSIGREDIPALVLSAGLIFALCRVSFGGRVGGREYVSVTLRRGDRQEKILALKDTGNTLRDPVTGEPVLVISGAVAKRLTGLMEEELSDPLGTMARRPLPGLRLIPYRAVGSRGQMLLALRFSDVEIGGRKQSAVVAFAPQGLGNWDMAQGLTGGVI